MVRGVGGGVGGLGDEAGYGKGVMGGEGLEGCGLRFGMVLGWEVGEAGILRLGSEGCGGGGGGGGGGG